MVIKTINFDAKEITNNFTRQKVAPGQGLVDTVTKQKLQK